MLNKVKHLHNHASEILPIVRMTKRGLCYGNKSLTSLP